MPEPLTPTPSLISHLEMYGIRHLQIQSAAEVLELVLRYYPANQMPVKTQYLIEGLFEEGKI
jgi:hypothetical protein